jgi:hypothetical protein
MVLATLEMDDSQARASIANEEANNIWMQGKYDSFIWSLF